MSCILCPSFIIQVRDDIMKYPRYRCSSTILYMRAVEDYGAFVKVCNEIGIEPLPFMIRVYRHMQNMYIQSYKCKLMTCAEFLDTIMCHRAAWLKNPILHASFPLLRENTLAPLKKMYAATQADFCVPVQAVAVPVPVPAPVPVCRPSIIIVSPEHIKLLKSVKWHVACLGICESCIGCADHAEFLYEVFPHIISSFKKHFVGKTVAYLSSWLSDVNDCIDNIEYVYGNDWYKRRTTIRQRIPEKITRVFPAQCRKPDIYGYTMLRIYSLLCSALRAPIEY